MMKRFLGFLIVFVGIYLALEMFRVEEEEFRKAPKKVGKQVRYVKGSADKIEDIISKFRSSLNERQIEILKLYTKSNVILPSDIYSLHPDVSTRTLRRDMSTLGDLGIIVQEGTTRDTRYLLNI